jgi:hypothetical protein
MNLWTFGKTPWTGDQPDAKATTYTGQHNTEKRGHTSMLQAGFEPAIPVLERSKAVYAFDRVAIGTGIF